MWKISGAKIHQSSTLFLHRLWALKPEAKAVQWVEDSSPTAQSFNSETIDSDPEPFFSFFSCSCTIMATLAHTPWQIENVRQTNENHKSLPRNLFRIREYFSHLNFYGEKGAFYVFILNQQSVERKFAFSDGFKAGWLKGRWEQKKGGCWSNWISVFPRNWNLHRRKKWFLWIYQHPAAVTSNPCLSKRR